MNNEHNSKLKSASVIHFSLMILMAKHPKVGLFVLLQCLRFESVREYCVVNSFASSLILINLLSAGCSCVLICICFRMVYIQQTKE